MVDYLSSVSLGLIEGVTGILPISSSAHILLTGDLFSISIKLISVVGIGSAIAIALRKFDTISKLSFKEFSLLLFSPVPLIVVALFMLLLNFEINDFANIILIGSVIGTTFLLIAWCSCRVVSHRNYSLGIIVSAFATIFSVIPGISRLGLSLGSNMIFGYSIRDSLSIAFITAIPVSFIAGFVSLYQTDFNTVNILVSISVAAFIAYTLFPMFEKFIIKFGLIPIIFYRIVFAILLIHFVI